MLHAAELVTRPMANPPLAATPEDLHYTVTLDGAPAGSAHWTIGPERNATVIRRETIFSGPLGQGRKLEVSKLDGGRPSMFTESGDGVGRGHFEVISDRRTGLLTVRQGRDEAYTALIQEVLDPLLLIQALRLTPADVRWLRVPMVGGTILATRLPDATLEAPWGEVEARVWYVRPGVNVVYLEAEAPFRPLRLTQETDLGVMEFVLELGLGRHSRQPEAISVASGRRPRGRQPLVEAREPVRKVVRVATRDVSQTASKRRAGVSGSRAGSHAGSAQNPEPAPRRDAVAEAVAPGTDLQESRRRRRRRGAGRSETGRSEGLGAEPSEPAVTAESPQGGEAGARVGPGRRRRRGRRRAGQDGGGA